jgi:hypothetical protein
MDGKPGKSAQRLQKKRIFFDECCTGFRLCSLLMRKKKHQGPTAKKTTKKERKRVFDMCTVDMCNDRGVIYIYIYIYTYVYTYVCVHT